MGCPFARDQDAVKKGQAMAMYWSNGNRGSERDRASGCGTFWIFGHGAGFSRGGGGTFLKQTPILVLPNFCEILDI